MANKYHYTAGDRLFAAQLNHELEFSSDTVPPGNPDSFGSRYKPWMDTSVNPPALRIATALTTTSTYVPTEWATLATLDLAARKFTFQGAWSGDLVVGGSLYLSGPLIAFNGNPTTARGPYITGDDTNFSFTLGPTSGAGKGFYFNTSPTNTVAVIDSVGNATFSGGINVALDITARDILASRNIWASTGTVTAGYMHSTGNVQADGALTGGSITVSGNMTTGNTITGGFIHSTGSIEANGNITADGAYINAAAYFLSGSVFANTGGIGERLIYDGGGGAALNLQANDSFYDNNTHHFRNSALGATFSLDSAGNGGFAGNISAGNGGFAGNITAALSVTGGYIHSTGDVHADNAFTGASVSITGHIQTGDIYSVTGYGMTDTTGAANFKIYSSGGYGFVQFLPSWFLQFNGTNGLLAWFIDLSGPTAFWLMRASDRLCFNSLGPVAGAGAYIDTSDRRSKKNIVPSHRGLAEVLELNPVEFDRISVVDAPREIGFVAQDVKDVMPEAVRVVGANAPALRRVRHEACAARWAAHRADPSRPR
jgi:hypothetical protein